MASVKKCWNTLFGELSTSKVGPTSCMKGETSTGSKFLVHFSLEDGREWVGAVLGVGDPTMAW